MYTTANFMGKSPIITQLEQATEELLAARRTLDSSMGEFQRTVAANLPEKRLASMEQYAGADRKGGFDDMRWVRHQQFLLAEALNHVGYTRAYLLASQEDHQTKLDALRALVRHAFDNVATVDGWQHSALTNAIVCAQSAINSPIPDYEWYKPIPEWLVALPGLEELVENALAQAFEIASGVIESAVVEPNFMVQPLLDAYPTDPVAVDTIDRGTKRTTRAKENRYVYTFELPSRLTSAFPQVSRVVALSRELRVLVEQARAALNVFRATEGARLNEGQHKAKMHELMSQADSAEAITKQIAKQSALRLDYISSREAFRYALTLALQKRAELVLALKQAKAEAQTFAATHPVVADSELQRVAGEEAWAQAQSEAPDNTVERAIELLKQPSPKIVAARDIRFQRQAAILNCLAADVLLRDVGATLAGYAEHFDDDLSDGEAAKEVERLMEQASKAFHS